MFTPYCHILHGLLSGTGMLQTKHSERPFNIRVFNLTTVVIRRYALRVTDHRPYLIIIRTTIIIIFFPYRIARRMLESIMAVRVDNIETLSDSDMYLMYFQ